MDFGRSLKVTTKPLWKDSQEIWRFNEAAFSKSRDAYWHLSVPQPTSCERPKLLLG